MIELSRFTLYYFSEVSAELLYRYRPEYGTYKISATHPRVTISDWFHFVDSDVEPRHDPLTFESEDKVEPVAKMAGKLSPAAVDILFNYEVDDAERQFFTDFMCGLAHGHYGINDPRDVEYIHPAGDWLLEQYEEFK